MVGGKVRGWRSSRVRNHDGSMTAGPIRQNDGRAWYSRCGNSALPVGLDICLPQRLAEWVPLPEARLEIWKEVCRRVSMSEGSGRSDRAACEGRRYTDGKSDPDEKSRLCVDGRPPPARDRPQGRAGGP